MSKKSGYYINYDFKYKGHREPYWDYELSFEELMKGIRKYFDDQLVNMDGTDTAVWNALVGLGEGIVDNIIEVMEKYLKEECKESAYEEFKDYVDWYYDDDEVEEY